MTEQKNDLSIENEENSQAKPILSALIWISWGVYLVALFSGLYWGDKKLIVVTLINCVILVIPFLLLHLGYVRASGYLLVLMVLVMVTIVATIGQGIHDLAILAYPIIIVFASLALDRFGFRIFVLLTFIAIAWLVFGEALGLFVTESYETPGLIDFLIITVILSAAALSVNLLSLNMRKNLDHAHQEIVQRKQAEAALLESEERYRNLSSMASEGIMVHEAGKILDANQTFADLVGYSNPEELIGKVGLESIPFTSESRQLIQSHFLEDYPDTIEVELIRSDGSLLSAETNARKLIYKGRQTRLVSMRDITERKQREKELQAIASLSASLRSAPNRMEMLPVIVEQLSHILNCDSILFQIIDEQTQDSVVEGAYGEWSSTIGSRQPNNTGLNAVLRETMVPYLNNHIKDDPRFVTLENVNNDNIVATAGVPLVAQDQVIGFLWMGGKKEITESEFHLLIAVADIAANAIHRSTLHERTLMHAVNLSQAYDSTLEGWARALELRDQETEGHARKVVQKTIDLAKRLGISNYELEHVRRGALLHDIGKMGIPDSILLKPGTLNEREWEIMRRHPEYAYNLMHPIEYLHPALDIPYCHHEKWDGSGYPRGVKKFRLLHVFSRLLMYGMPLCLTVHIGNHGVRTRQMNTFVHRLENTLIQALLMHF
jgi:PAS domain S-box-containing protein